MVLHLHWHLANLAIILSTRAGFGQIPLKGPHSGLAWAAAKIRYIPRTKQLAYPRSCGIWPLKWCVYGCVFVTVNLHMLQFRSRRLWRVPGWHLVSVGMCSCLHECLCPFFTLNISETTGDEGGLLSGAYRKVAEQNRMLTSRNPMAS